ncbi:hypothetical protein OAO91_11405 [Luminiphilus sp.]|nr:hypothetical protein [Luminiphilus sp.]
MSQSENVFRVFIGYDERQAVSYTALQHSILETASQPVSVTPLILDTLPITRRGLTPFTFSRFLVPWLCNFQGHALFLDADMFVVSDICEMTRYFNDEHAISVVRSIAQFEQSSVMLFNNAHSKNRTLTPDFIQNTEENMHGLCWLDEADIGEMDGKWNQLVGYQECQVMSGNLHFTMGVPAFPETSTSEFGQIWTDCAKRAIGVTQTWEEIMGSSVHALKINGISMPKYVWDQRDNKPFEQHASLVNALVTNLGSFA